jgi:hypothetical protein
MLLFFPFFFCSLFKSRIKEEDYKYDARSGRDWVLSPSFSFVIPLRASAYVDLLLCYIILPRRHLPPNIFAYISRKIPLRIPFPFLAFPSLLLQIYLSGLSHFFSGKKVDLLFPSPFLYFEVCLFFHTVFSALNALLFLRLSFPSCFPMSCFPICAIDHLLHSPELCLSIVYICYIGQPCRTHMYFLSPCCRPCSLCFIFCCNYNAV